MFKENIFDNILLMTDSYKVSHRNGYIPKLQVMQSYLESRGGEYDSTVFFGLQYFLLKYLSGEVISMKKIEEAHDFWEAHFGRKDVFHRATWIELLEAHGGHLPIKIRAVREGSLIPTRNVLMTIENTDERFPWLVNYLETLLMQLWYPTTVATQEHYTKQRVAGALRISGDPEGINFKVHDFGYRGVSCPEQAGLGAAAHLLSFLGTDTVAGISLLKHYYGADKMCGFSIPATEHSIMCSFGRENEVQACQNWLNQYPSGLIACVSDTYDIYNACENIWGGVLLEQVKSRDGCLVIRPDSGDYFEVIPKVLEILWRKFGGTINAKGFKVLDSHVRVIQGDGMDPKSIGELYSHILTYGWSADNLAVGSGGGMLMKVNRDTNKFAIKACAAKVDGKWIDIWKDPITDKGKKSKTGRLDLILTQKGDIESIRAENFKHGDKGLLSTVFENGNILKFYNLEDIKRNMRTPI